MPTNSTMRTFNLRLRSRHLIAAALLAAAPGTAWAQSQDQLEALQKQQETNAAIATANATIATQNSNRMATLLSPLTNLSTATGETDLTDKGGAFEAWIMSARAMDPAAKAIRTSLGGHGDKFVVLSGTETLDTANVGVMRALLAELERQAAGFPAKCPLPSRVHTLSGTPDGAQDFPIASAVLTVLGALRTDTTISGAEGPSDAEMLINALTASAGGGAHFYRPGDITAVIDVDQNPLWQAWGRVDQRMPALTKCAADLKAAKKPTGAYDAYISAVDSFRTTSVLTAEGKSPLVRAIQLSALEQYPVVRIIMAKSGGSLIKRKNILTSFGARAITVTGGAVVTWRATKPATGEMIAGGNLLCTTEVTGLRQVQDRNFKRDAANCTAF